MSYGASLADSFRQAGAYVARTLEGSPLIFQFSNRPTLSFS
jgi:hypothetical protein